MVPTPQGVPLLWNGVRLKSLVSEASTKEGLVSRELSQFWTLVSYTHEPPTLNSALCHIFCLSGHFVKYSRKLLTKMTLGSNIKAWNSIATNLGPVAFRGLVILGSIPWLYASKTKVIGIPHFSQYLLAECALWITSLFKFSIWISPFQSQEVSWNLIFTSGKCFEIFPTDEKNYNKDKH